MRRRIIGAVLLLVAAVLAGILAAVWNHYRIERVYVTGNTQYSEEEIKELVMDGPLSENALYLSWKYKKRTSEDLPFVEKVEVEILDPNTVRIKVYEKAIAGYIEYVGQYIYFSRDGTVVEASDERIAGIPEVRGLTFDQIVLYQKLKTENDEVFEQILNTTQLLSKYGLTADKIFFDKNYNMTLFFGGVRVLLGQNTFIDEKIANLQFIIPHLQGKSGTIDMSSYTPGTVYTTFREKPASEEEEAENSGS